MTSFSTYLMSELLTQRYALLKLIEEYERMRYVEGAALRREYMDKIGCHEEKAMEAELEVALLQRKTELIQASINQGSPPDLEAIEAHLADERHAMLADAEADDSTLNEMPVLTPEEREEMQRLYRAIIDSFHPSMNHNLTAVQRDLYQKAQEAYQRQSLESLRLIHAMLFQDEGIEISLNVASSVMTEEDSLEELAQSLSVDFALAGKLFPRFQPLIHDAVFTDALQSYQRTFDETKREMDQMLREFPFSARETLNSPELTQAYLDDVKLRISQARADQKRLEARIDTLMKEATALA